MQETSSTDPSVRCSHLPLLLNEYLPEQLCKGGLTAIHSYSMNGISFSEILEPSFLPWMTFID